MTTVRIVAAVVDTTQLILYKEDGNTISILQGDLRIRKIIDEITPTIMRGEIAEIDLGKMNVPNVYKEFEQQSPLIKFFRVAKKFVQHIIDGTPEPVAPTTIGSTTLNLAIDQIMENAQSVTEDSFHTGDSTNDDTIIAVVEDKIIPGVEQLEAQFANANKLGSPVGVQNFLRRIAAVIDQRGHSIADLLRFMERGDLPIADDGSVIIYKVLKTTSQPGVYVDMHTKQVKQRIGSYVCMDPKLVDPNRHNECSTGLHVARRGYLSGFNGDALLLGKVDPEDFIAVPHNDANKVRVCGYHLIAKLSPSDHDTLKNNRPMTDNMEARKILGQAIAGQHIGRIETVLITGPRGTGLVITPNEGQGGPNKKDAPEALAIDDTVMTTEIVDPKEVAKEVTAAKQGMETKAMKVARLVNIVAGQGSKDEQIKAAWEIYDLKKKSKVSYHSLGVGMSVQMRIEDLVKANPFAQPVTTTPATTSATTFDPIKEEVIGVVEIPVIIPLTPVPVPIIEPEAPSNVVDFKPANRPISPTLTQQATKFFLDEKFPELWELKRRAKKTWAQLGFEGIDIDTIMAHAPLPPSTKK